MLRISKDGRRTMKSLGVSVDPKFWNFDTNQPKPNCPNRQLIRQIALKYESEYNGKILVSTFTHLIRKEVLEWWLVRPIG